MSRGTRLLPVLVLCLAGVAACSSDDQSSPVEASPTAPVTDGEETTGSCDASVSIKGDVKASWEADGLTILQDGTQAFYKTAKGKYSLTIFPEIGDTPASAVFTRGGNSYTTQGPEGVTADPAGSGADVDATATGIKRGKDVVITASFTCTD